MKIKSAAEKKAIGDIIKKELESKDLSREKLIAIKERVLELSKANNMASPSRDHKRVNDLWKSVGTKLDLLNFGPETKSDIRVISFK